MQITLAYGDDWNALYLDGKLAIQRHDLSPSMVLGALGIDHRDREIDYTWLKAGAPLPTDEADVVWFGENPHAWARTRS